MDTHPIETITSLIRAAQAAGKAFAAGKTPDKIDAGVEDAAWDTYKAFIGDREEDDLREFQPWRLEFGRAALI